MADILIRGMEMPDRCSNCWLMDGEDSWCCATRGRHLDPEYRYGIKDKPDFCPLAELPPHGDLIDLDERVTKQVYNEYKMEWDMKTKTVRQWLNIDVADMPVIVPANKEETA